MTNDSPTPFATADELDFETARAAYRWTSHTPDERGRSDQKAFADDVNGLYEEMLKLATTEAQQAILAEQMQRYKAGYLQHFGAYLHSHSRCASSMITGPANFPVRQQQKRGDAADRKRQEFLEWRERARAAIKKAVLEARSPEEKTDAAWDALRKDINSSLTEIAAIDEHGSPFTRSSFVNSIVGKVERLAEQGEVDLVEKALALVREYNEAHDKPAISSRNGFWELDKRAKEKAAAHDATLDKEPEVIAEAPGVQLVANYALDRAQLVFDAKPGQEMREKLKRSGWKWSPTNDAWQRQLTPAALASGRAIVEGMRPAREGDGVGGLGV